MGNKGTVILGSTGMLGSMLAKTWPEALAVDRTQFSVEKPDRMLLADATRVINCIGLIKPYTTDVEQTIRVNALFPYSLPENTIQIATDCVYSGKKGRYVETDPHDALDVYGKTKSLGEAPHISNLRCSIIGPEIKTHTSLLDWFLSQEEVNGYTNHLWNGITTYHFSMICQGIVREGIELPNLQHIVPADAVTKHELLGIIAKAYGKKITVNPILAEEYIDRTLATNNSDLNRQLWEAAGYNNPPTIEEMVEELAYL
jgi:dTDP-4-dehydrorhamnose reductase